MEINTKGTIEAILFSAGNPVEIKDLQLILEKSKDEIEEIINQMNMEYKDNSRGIEIIKADNTYQMASRKEYYDSIYKIIDKRSKPKLSNAALETLSIIAYNPRVSKSEIEAIRTTPEFLKMFGYTSLKDLPELPKYKLDSNKQIVIDELVEE